MSKPKGKHPTNRRVFLNWLEHELREAGGVVPQPTKFADLINEIERIWVVPVAKSQGRRNYG